VARAAGLSAAQSRLETFEDRQALVVTRYDRAADGTRLHQEDCCQLLGLDPQAKYETLRPGPTRLSNVARLASPHAESPDQFRIEMLAAITFNLLIGNGDAHSKNYSVFIGSRGQVTLATLYDTAPVMFIDARYKSTGHVVNGLTSIDRVRADDLTDEAGTWGLPRARAAEVVRTTVEAVRTAVETTELPPELVDVRERMGRRRLANGWSATIRVAPDDAGGDVSVSGYVNHNGTWVPGHARSRPRRG
jgi:serine/threonine-protein kinase HipA